MTKPAEASPPEDIGLSAEQRQTVLAFLGDKARVPLLETWLEEWGISSFKAKVVVKLLVPGTPEATCRRC
jgi:hypothetical protein